MEKIGHPHLAEQLNLQEVRGQAKPNQIRQFLRLVERLRSDDGEGTVTDHHINVFYSEEDEGYIADIPDLEACSAFGSTPEEALAEVQKAKEAWIVAARGARASHPGASLPPRYIRVIPGWRSPQRPFPPQQRLPLLTWNRSSKPRDQPTFTVPFMFAWYTQTK